jgi:hypothetical protein
MSIEKVPKGAPDSNGLDQYDYADMSAGDSTSGTSQLQIASLSQEEQYAILNPNVFSFNSPDNSVESHESYNAKYTFG